MLGGGPTHRGQTHHTSGAREKCHTPFFMHVRAFKRIHQHSQQKAYLEPYNIGVHMPRTHEGSYPSKVITMRPSDSSSSQHKLNGSSMKPIAATRSFAAECKSSRLGARRAR